MCTYILFSVKLSNEHDLMFDIKNAWKLKKMKLARNLLKIFVVFFFYENHNATIYIYSYYIRRNSINLV